MPGTTAGAAATGLGLGNIYNRAAPGIAKRMIGPPQ
jgi:hypothetical protein